MTGDCVVGEGLGFAGVDGNGGSDSADACLDTPLFTGSFAFSEESVCCGAVSATGWEEGTASVELSSGDCVARRTSSCSASTCLLFFPAVEKKNNRTFCE